MIQYRLLARGSNKTAANLLTASNLENDMKKDFRNAYNALKKIGVPVYVRDDMDGRFQISAEEPESYQWASMYSRNPSWDFGVNPKIDALLDKYNLYCEWINAGELGVYHN
jgi:hypothetical protein